MSRQESVKLLTAPSRRFSHDPSRRPQRNFVLSVETNEERLWSPRKSYESGFIDDEEELRSIDLVAPKEFIERLFSFFKKYLMTESAYGHYNCHRFALWMLGSPEVAKKRLSS